MSLLTLVEKVLLGAVLCVLFVVLLATSVPVYIIRVGVIWLAKLFRPDIGEILSGQSLIIANDHFSKKPPRHHVITTVVLKDQVTWEEMKTLVMKRWILAKDQETGKPTFEKFTQYPYNWLGFPFWKDIPLEKFCVERYVHRVSETSRQITEMEVNEIAEKLLNVHIPRDQSPWEIHVVENYKNPLDPGNPSSLFILKVHHVLADGFSIMTALVEGLSQQSLSSQKIPLLRLPKRTTWENIVRGATLLLSGFWEMSSLMSHNFQESPWKVTDDNKKWYQVCAKSNAIPTQVIRDVKKKFGVSFTSVLFTAVSAAIRKSLGEEDPTESMLCMCAIPVTGYGVSRKLTNHMSAIVLELPTIDFETPLRRLHTIHEILLHQQNSVVPLIVENLSGILGVQFTNMAGALSKNRSVSLGLSNFPFVPSGLHINGKPVIDVDFMVGCTQGVCGLGIMVISYEQHLRIRVTAEKALMTQEQVQRFVEYITEEIYSLRGLMMSSH